MSSLHSSSLVLFYIFPASSFSSSSVFNILFQGRGSFGEVYIATWFQTTVAVKKLPLEVQPTHPPTPPSPLYSYPTTTTHLPPLFSSPLLLSSLLFSSQMLRTNATVLEEFGREINLLKSLRHPNILQFLGSCSVPPNICLVTEFLPRGKRREKEERGREREREVRERERERERERVGV